MACCCVFMSSLSVSSGISSLDDRAVTSQFQPASGAIGTAASMVLLRLREVLKSLGSCFFPPLFVDLDVCGMRIKSVLE